MVMSIFVLPPLLHVMRNWPAELGITSNRKANIVSTASKTHILNTAVMAGGYTVLTFSGVLDASVWGMDRLLAFCVGQVAFGAIILIPLFLIPVTVINYSGK